MLNDGIDNRNPFHAQLYFEDGEDETLSIATPFCLKPVELIHTRERVTIKITYWIFIYMCGVKVAWLQTQKCIK